MENSSLESLYKEVEFYRQNQSVVEEEIKTLIADNQNLSKRLGLLLKEKLENERHTYNNNTEQSQELADMRKQVSLLTKERDSLHVLWQTSQKTIEALEIELKTYQDYDEGGPQNHITEDKRGLGLKLETALNDYVDLEKKYKALQKRHAALENEIKNKDGEIISYKERGKELEGKINDLNNTIVQNNIELAAEKKCREDLKNQLVLCQKECVNIVKKEAEAKSKVAEALQLFDLVSTQKDAAYNTIRTLTGEILELKQNLSSIKENIESGHRKEMDEIKQKYNEKVADMLDHIKNLDSELMEKGLLLNKTLRENKILQESQDEYLKQHKENLKTVDPKLAIAEQRLEAMFQELISSERRNIQLVCEKQCLAIDIQRIQDIHTRETKRRDWEEQLLKNQCEELKVQVEHLQKSLDETHAMVNKLQNILSSRTELNHKLVSTKEEELVELNKHLENQMELSKKWKDSYIEMNEKLKKKLKDLEKENNEFRVKLKLPHIDSNQEESTTS